MLLFAGASHGLGFGPPQATAVIGRPLSLSLPLQVQAGETFDAECVQVDVQLGDRRLPPYAVRWQVSAGSRADQPLLQVSTLGVLDEPVVAVQVSSGCPPRVSRRITLLTQLPGGSAQALAAGPDTADAAAPTPQRGVSTAAPRPLRNAATTRSRQPAGADSLRLDRLLAPPGVAATAGAAATLVAMAAPQPTPSTRLAAPAAVAMGVQVALADTATQAATDQIKLLEQQVQQVLTEARRQQDQLAQLRQRLSAAESANAWLPWLLLGLGGSAAMVAWLTLRVRRLQRELEHRHWSAAADKVQALAAADVAEAGAAPLLSPDQPLLSPRNGALAVAAAPDTPSAPQERAVAAQASAVTRPSNEFSLGTGVPPRPVSVEELLDLEQQVDFFLVLGQEQAAIDLLLSHVRSTGGINALPYFKLLEIYRQKGDEEAYERTRERFNQRFNAVAPAVDGDLMAGCCLEDYADVVLRLQRAWPQPLRAVAELESLLLRRADLEPFDLPAYREILMLHALVRDLPAGAMSPATTTVPKVALSPLPDPALPGLLADAEDAAVDLLLPLDDGPLDITVPHSQVSERASAQAMLAEWVFTRTSVPRAPAEADLTASLGRHNALAAVDLDLSDFAPAPREFTRPAAFTDIDHRRDSRLSDLDGLDEHTALPPTSRR